MPAPGCQFETQAAFARRLGMNKSTITRAKVAGRLVLTDNGLVDIQASLVSLSATEGAAPGHAANRERFAELRGQASAPVAAALAQQDAAGSAGPGVAGPGGAPWGAAPAPTDQVAVSLAAIGHNTKLAAMQRLQAVAEMTRRANELDAGTVIRRDQVRADLTTAAGIILSQLQTLPDLLAPLLLHQTDQMTVRTIIAEGIEDAQRRAVEELGRIAAEPDA